MLPRYTAVRDRLNSYEKKDTASATEHSYTQRGEGDRRFVFIEVVNSSIVPATRLNEQTTKPRKKRPGFEIW